MHEGHQNPRDHHHHHQKKKEHENPIIPPLQFRDDKPLQEPDSITDKPSPKIKELNRAFKGHAKSYKIEIQDNLSPLNHFKETKSIGRIASKRPIENYERV